VPAVAAQDAATSPPMPPVAPRIKAVFLCVMTRCVRLLSLDGRTECAWRAQNKIDQISRLAIYICMTTRSPDWSLYRSFLSVLRTGSLSAAAREEG